MNTALLQQALILWRFRNFGRAASALKISQPTLSRNIASLERELGLRIFERSHREIVPTTAGGDVLKMANDLVARAEAMTNSLQLVRDGRGGRLRVATGTLAGEVAVHRAMTELMKLHPDIRFELLEREWDVMIDLLMSDRVDFAVMDAGEVRDLRNLKIIPLARLETVFVCRAGHPLADKKNVRFADMGQFPFVGPPVPPRFRELISAIDPGMSIDAQTGSLMPSITVSSFQRVFEVVGSTDALSFAVAAQVRAAGRQDLFKILDVNESLKGEARLGIVHKRHRTLPPAAHVFIKVIGKSLRTASK